MSIRGFAMGYGLWKKDIGLEQAFAVSRAVSVLYIDRRGKGGV
jgi:hypothetical protein